MVELSGALGLDLEAAGDAAGQAPAEVMQLVSEREDARRRKDWAAADALRDRIRAAGWAVEDRQDGALVKPSIQTGVVIVKGITCT